MELQEPLWWNADRTKLLAKGDPDAAFAYGGTSTRVPLEQAVADGLVKAPKEKAAKAEAPAEKKPAAKKKAAAKK